MTNKAQRGTLLIYAAIVLTAGIGVQALAQDEFPSGSQKQQGIHVDGHMPINGNTEVGTSKPGIEVSGESAYTLTESLKKSENSPYNHSVIQISGSPSVSYERQKIYNLFDRGFYKQAIRSAAPLAEKGDAEMQVLMGRMLESGGGGVGVEDSLEKDPVAAAQWYRKAAEQQHTLGCFHLGRAYLRGIGVAQDDEQAEKWLGVAMQQNYTPAKELYASYQNKQDHLIGLGDERFSKLFLSETDFPGMMRKTQVDLDDKTGTEDVRFESFAGIRKGMVVWMGSNPEAYFRIVDIRWTFPSVWTAKSYLDQNRSALSENLSPVVAADDQLDQVLAFSGEDALAKAMSIRLHHWILLMRQGNVLAKIYLAVDPEKQPGFDNGRALAVARRLAARLTAEQK